MEVLIVNGPNLNLLGTREPDIYGSQSFSSYFTELQKKYPDCKLSSFQSNVEGELINALQEARVDAIILNPAGYGHTSVALADCVAGIDIPVIEVHISNVHGREDFRRTLLIAPHASGTISGFGLDSYELALIKIMRLS